MKKSIISICLCFTIILSSINFSFAEHREFTEKELNNISTRIFPGLVVAPEVLAAIGTVAVASGVIVSSVDDILNIANYVYSSYEGQKEDIEKIFFACSSIASNKVVSIGKEFIDICKNAFDSYKSSEELIGSSIVNIYGGYPVYNGWTYGYNSVSEFNALKGVKATYDELVNGKTFHMGEYEIVLKDYTILINGTASGMVPNWGKRKDGIFCLRQFSNKLSITWQELDGSRVLAGSILNLTSELSNVKLPSFESYNPGNISTDEKLPVYIPGNVSDLIGQGSSDVIYNPGVSNPPYELPNGGIVSFPNVSVPGITVGDNVSIPGVENPPVDVPDVENPPVDVPGEGIWATIRDFIISLVVPSDTFWTDTWNGLYNNFVSCFPGVDMSNFNSLVTGEKKFPNIDINIMSVKGRVVNGDVINSIVNWLRPIIAGFMMLCLMFFNYRKIYKLIRNSEPFGGISPGTSDFNARMSEYQGGR